MRLLQELESLKNRNNLGRGSDRNFHQNNHIDYSQAIRELSQKNQELKNELYRQRINGSHSNGNNGNEDQRYKQLMRKYEQLQNDNFRMKRDLGYS